MLSDSVTSTTGSTVDGTDTTKSTIRVVGFREPLTSPRGEHMLIGGSHTPTVLPNEIGETASRMQTSTMTQSFQVLVLVTI